LVQAGEEKYSHLDPAEVGKVEKAITEKTEWYNRSVTSPSPSPLPPRPLFVSRVIWGNTVLFV
jgi:hypothetical protein